MSVTKREKTLIIVVLILAVLCVYFVYFLQPCLKQLDELAADKARKELLVSTNEQIQQNVGLVDNKISDEENQLAQYGTNVQSEFDQPEAVVYLYKTISDYGQKITFNFEQASDTGNMKINVVYITLKSTYEGMKNIIKALNEGEYFVKITGVNATPDIPDEVPAAVSPVDGTGQTPAPTPTPSPSVQEYMLNVGITLEFYNFGGEIPPDKQYTFSEGASYGGDIFY